MNLRSLLLVGLLLFTSSMLIQALPFQQASNTQTGKRMSFQGTLFENGSPVTGERSFTFSIDLEGGNTWTETQDNVQIIEGLYAVTLGSINPMPEDLFYGVEGRLLTVSVGNTVLGTTELVSPFSPKAIGPIDDLPRRIVIDNAKADSDTIFYFKISADNLTQGSQKGLQVDMTGQGFKMALRGNTISQAGDPSGAIAVIGSATGQGTGTHEGVRGQAFGAGKFNSGVLGLAGGPGNGGTGYEGEGSYNTGVVGYGQSNAWGNTGVTGYAVGTQGVDNIGVVGIASVGAEGDTQIENKGVLGRAEGLGINKAIWGRAINGVENWAGWFEGNMAIRDGGDLQVFAPNGDIKIDLNYFEDNDSGSLVLHGHNNTRRAILGSSSDRSGGILNLYDSLDRAAIRLRASSRTETWITDDRPHGQLELNGPDSRNFYLGSRVWEDNGANVGIFQLFGKPVASTQNPGTFDEMEGIFMSVEDFGDGAQQGLLQLTKEGQGNARLNYDNLSKMIGMVQGGGKYRFEVNPQNSGVLKLMSSVDSVNVLIDSNGPKAGLIMLNDSLGRANLTMYSQPGGGSYIGMNAGFPDIGEGELRTTYQLAGGLANPWTNMISRNADGTVKGRVQSGFLYGDGTFNLTDANNRSIAQLRGSNVNGGDLHLQGPTTSNIWIGQKNWQNSDLPFIAMRGSQGINDGNGGTYVPDGIVLEVTEYGDGSENGAIHLSRIENGTSLSVSLDYNSLKDLYDNRPVYGYNYNANNIIYNLGPTGVNGNLGIMELFGSIERNDGNGGTYVPSLAVLRVNEETNNGIEWSALDLSDNVGSTTASLSVYPTSSVLDLTAGNSSGETTGTINTGWSGDSGYLNMIDRSNNGYNQLVALGASTTNGASLSLNGPSTNNFSFVSRSWDNNDQPYMSLTGSQTVPDGNGGTYIPESISITATTYGDGSENGLINFSRIENGQIKTTGLDYSTLNSLVNPTNFRLYDSNDNNVVSIVTPDDGNGFEFGAIYLSSNVGGDYANIYGDGFGDFSGDVTAANFYQTSDERLKENIITLTSGLAKVNKLRGVRYNWKNDNKQEGKIGFIAQEVEKILPELVTTKKDGFKAVNYAEMTAILVEAVKELSSQLEALKQENKTLKAEASKVVSMEERLAKIEALLLNNSNNVNTNNK